MALYCRGIHIRGEIRGLRRPVRKGRENIASASIPALWERHHQVATVQYRQYKNHRFEQASSAPFTTSPSY